MLVVVFVVFEILVFIIVVVIIVGRYDWLRDIIIYVFLVGWSVLFVL